MQPSDLNSTVATSNHVVTHFQYKDPDRGLLPTGLGKIMTAAALRGGWLQNDRTG
jgi:hypothetical protein